MAEIITATQLKSWLAEKRELVLIDTAPSEEFEAEHIAGAQNACVYEVVFIDTVKGLKGLASGLLARVTGGGSHANDVIVVYGSSTRSLASSVAAEKLEAAGFTRVYDLRGGLEEWKGAGNPTDLDLGKLGSTALADGAHPLDLAESSVEWTGRNLFSKHTGTIGIKWGELDTKGGLPVSAQCLLDMSSIAVSDLANHPVLRATLVKHLASEDFFDVAKYPEAKFSVQAFEPIADAVAGQSNYLMRGKLRVKGKEEEVEIPAAIGPGPDGTLVARAHFDLDRTRWGVVYGSGRFFEQLGKHVVSETVSFEVKIVALSRLG